MQKPKKEKGKERKESKKARTRRVASVRPRGLAEVAERTKGPSRGPPAHPGLHQEDSEGSGGSP